ncbi:YheU family protein [Motiliproteus coralliicola]|uniref:YheU family protein n=1 Tax=Motiliproteus coralliicola TaxID=2283196 RepID=A0A369WK72_9GAMM|nr:YheU family protein [Motiliproteus coralliicola]RDE22448.1 YheU family protein [Motiliproteus coralliicola]
MQIPHDQLSADALQGLLEEFVTREGTDYGDVNYSLADKVDQVRQQLQAGDVVICFDSYMQSCTLMTRQQYRRWSEQQFDPDNEA